MKLPLGKRRLAVLGALGAAMAATLLVVLPAFGSTANDQVLPPTHLAGVIPTDIALGGNATCSSLGFPSTQEYDVSVPKNGSVNFGGGVSFDIMMNSAYDQGQPAYGSGKYFDFTLHGARLIGMGVKGGTHNTRYDFAGSQAGAWTSQPPGTASDQGLHAPAQNWTSNGTQETPTQLYSVSSLTVCYQTVYTSVAGLVYRDANDSGGFDTGDTGLSGWTVNLYKAGSSTPSATTTSQTDGSYAFSNVVENGATYRICEVPKNGDLPSWANHWSQSKPTSGATCSGTGEAAKGNNFTAGAAVIDDDFGNVPSYVVTPTTGPFGFGDGSGTTYELGTPKSGTTYTFIVGNLATGEPFVKYTTDNTSTKVPTVERIVVSDPVAGDGFPTYTKLLYSDTEDPSLVQMQSCKLDPRTDSGYALNSAYTTVAGSGDVLPDGATSCVIVLQTYVDGSGAGWLQAYTYSLSDSIRSTG